MATREKILKLATKITREGKSGLIIKPTDPEYRILEPVVTDEMADVALCLKVRKPMVLKDISILCSKPEEETKQLLWELADAGVCFIKTIAGVDNYWLPIWVPGIMEMMVNTKKMLKNIHKLQSA